MRSETSSLVYPAVKEGKRGFMNLNKTKSCPKFRCIRFIREAPDGRFWPCFLFYPSSYIIIFSLFPCHGWQGETQCECRGRGSAGFGGTGAGDGGGTGPGTPAPPKRKVTLMAIEK